MSTLRLSLDVARTSVAYKRQLRTEQAIEQWEQREARERAERMEALGPVQPVDELTRHRREVVVHALGQSAVDHDSWPLKVKHA